MSVGFRGWEIEVDIPARLTVVVQATDPNDARAEADRVIGDILANIEWRSAAWGTEVLFDTDGINYGSPHHHVADY